MIFVFESNQRIADLGPTRQLGLGQGVRHRSVESADIINFVNMVKNTCMCCQQYLEPLNKDSRPIATSFYPYHSQLMADRFVTNH